MALFDDNAEVLRRMEERGTDLSWCRVVDFSHIFADARSAHNFIDACESAGYASKDTTDDEMDHYDVTVSVMMAPTCENVSDTEEALAKLALEHGGHSDGSGFFTN